MIERIIVYYSHHKCASFNVFGGEGRVAAMEFNHDLQIERFSTLIFVNWGQCSLIFHAVSTS